MLKLLIADMSEEFTDAVEKALHGAFEIQICHDGETALELLHYFKPDVLIIHLLLPFKDGLTVLQESTHKPRIIMAIAHYLPPYAEKRALELGVQYLLFSPTVETLRVRLMDMIAETQPREDTRVAVHLHTLGFRTNLDGYRQLCEGIPIYAQSPGILLSKELYPIIAGKFCLPDYRTVEHSIRKAITDAWFRRNPIIWEKYFPGATEAPTNKVLISKLAEMSRL